MLACRPHRYSVDYPSPCSFANRAQLIPLARHRATHLARSPSLKRFAILYSVPALPADFAAERYHPAVVLRDVALHLAFLGMITLRNGYNGPLQRSHIPTCFTLMRASCDS